ncbi:MAG: NERD domain-containing protein [Gammaproteobacteria bacterium]|nr:NERD domain-containing protein [Gammaproteobacteria bacterium]
MAHYLQRAFAQKADIQVLHNVRLEDRKQPEHAGSPGVCQIDHLILHRWGLFIIESKSVIEEIRVRSDGSGGDEWTRTYAGREVGMASPIQQARRQGQFLRTYLERHRETLLGRERLGLRTLAKVVRGTDQRGFASASIQLIVAVSDRGKIERLGGWKEPREPLAVFVSKADLVPEKIQQEVDRHRKELLADNEYGFWSMKADEVESVAVFLAARHTDGSEAGLRPSNPPGNASQDVGGAHYEPSSDQNGAKCEHCGASTLSARWGRYGYYWTCRACERNTPIPTVCSSCQTKGRRGDPVRVRKSGSTFRRECSACGYSEVVWTEPSPSSSQGEP